MKNYVVVSFDKKYCLFWPLCKTVWIELFKLTTTIVVIVNYKVVQHRLAVIVKIR